MLFEIQEINAPDTAYIKDYKFGLVLWHINLCRLFNAKSIFM